MKITKKTFLFMLCCAFLAAGSASADPSTGHGPGLDPVHTPAPPLSAAEYVHQQALKVTPFS